jgi:hypothetical protein
MSVGAVRRRASVAGILAGLGFLLPAHGEPGTLRVADQRPSYNLFGVTGLIDMPSAEGQPDAQIALTTAYMGGQLRNTLNFQILPRLEGTFRYSILDSYFSNGEALYDRSFDIKLRLVDEGDTMPAIALGLQDFLGTGIYSGEYIVATKHITPTLKLTGGVGWGRFANANSVTNPLGYLADGAKNRASSEGQIGNTGRVRFGQFFRGEDIGFFGGLEWHAPIDGLSVKAELSSDDYARDFRFTGTDIAMPLNFGVEYRPWEGVELGAYAMYGTTFGLRATFTGNPDTPLTPADARDGPLPISPRVRAEPPSVAARFGPVRELIDERPAQAGAPMGDVTVETVSTGPRWAYVTLTEAQAGACPLDAARRVDADLGVVDGVTFRDASGAPVCTVVLRPAGRAYIAAERRPTAGWDTSWHNDAAAVAAAVAAAIEAVGEEKLAVEALLLAAEQIDIEITNAFYAANAQAIGRAASALARVLPPSVERINITLNEATLPAVTVALRRALMEEQTGEPDAARRSWLSAGITDAYANGPRPDPLPDRFPAISWGINPHVPLGLFDPDSPVRADLQVRLFAGLEVARGLSLNGQISQSLFGNLGDSSRASNSVLPRVRSDVALYAQNDGPAIDRLTGDWMFKLAPDTYGRLSAGYLEQMYAGVSAEVLWKPIDSRWGLGVELNYVQQREFDQFFGLQDYTVLTGHGSVYWNTGWLGLEGQVDAGRYLAGDWGATFSLTRKFANGWEVGGFFTLTDVPFADYGEGSFDKGLRVTIPLGWAVPFESRSKYTTEIRPLTRDGGQRLNVSNRLYDVVAETDRAALREDWSAFWK